MGVYKRPVPPPPAKRRPPRGRRGPVVLAAGMLVLLVVAWAATAAAPSGGTAASSGSLPAVSTSATSQDMPASGAQPTAPGPVWQDMQNLQLPALDYRAMALPANGRVDMKYFASATFVGDSITQGLQMYAQGIKNAHYCAYTSIGPKGIYDGSVWPNLNEEQEVPMDALVASQPSSVYILLGANTITNTQDDVFLTYYREMLRQMKQKLPTHVQYYIQSITPVRPTASYGMDRVNALNDQLAKLAYEEGAYFIDLSEPLLGEDGYLREEFNASADGIHLTPAGYSAWVEHLVTHTAYAPSTPYLPGSPYL